MVDNLSDCNEIKCDGEKGSKKLFYLEIYLKGFNTLFESNYIEIELIFQESRSAKAFLS